MFCILIFEQILMLRQNYARVNIQYRAANAVHFLPGAAAAGAAGLGAAGGGGGGAAERRLCEYYIIIYYINISG